MTDNPDDLVIQFPATGGFLNISRLNATAMAADLGFDVERLDDLRLAVDEAVAWLVQDEDTGGVVELVIRSGDRQLDFLGRRSQAGLPPRELGDLMEAILGATVDEYQTGEDDDGRRYISLHLRA